MRYLTRSKPGLFACLAACCLIAATGPAASAGFDAERTLRADQLLVRNLIGTVEVRAHDAADFVVELRARGRDATAERIRIDAAEGSYAELIVEFPLDESRQFIYPALGHGRASISPNEGRGVLSRVFGIGRNIEVSGDGRGLEAWVDVTVRVPRGKTLKVEHGVGRIVVGDLEAALDLTCGSCPIEVAALVGDLKADTGSGSVTVRDVRGSITADTGSGKVVLSRCQGERIAVDTGSGHVEMDTIDGRRVIVDTGSGGVSARALGADDLEIDTGSGRVELELTRMGSGSFKVDTGSGGVDLRLPPDASALILADTGSGGIHLDLDQGYEVVKLDDDSAELRVGGGAARVVLDTGSGGIRLSQ